jgi:cyclic pyranopterin phosphate synthase
MSDLTHIGPDGRAQMVDVASKPETERTAEARGQVRMKASTFRTIESGQSPKGEVLRTAELAGILAAKRTGELIPLCHPLPLSGIWVTAVEMEARTAVSIACLTIYDMAKAIDHDLVIDQVELVAKSGGRSGDWRRD